MCPVSTSRAGRRGRPGQRSAAAAGAVGADDATAADTLVATLSADMALLSRQLTVRKKK